MKVEKVESYLDPTFEIWPKNFSLFYHSPVWVVKVLPPWLLEQGRLLASSKRVTKLNSGSFRITVHYGFP